MPDTIVERATRHLIAAARECRPEDHPWSLLPDGHMAAPLFVAFLQSAADLVEYLVDVHGGIDGTAEFRAVLHTLEAGIPTAPTAEAEPCPCKVHSPGGGHVRSTLQAAYRDDVLAARRPPLRPRHRRNPETPTAPIQKVPAA